MEIWYIEENQLKSRLLLSFQTYNKSFQERRVFFRHYAADIVDQLPRLGKRELICLLLFTCNYVISVWRVSSPSGCLGWLRYFIEPLSEPPI